MSIIIFAKGQHVGIGIDTANAMLHVKSADSAVLLLQNAATSGTNVKTALYFKTGNYYGGGIATIGTLGTHRMGFFTYGDQNASGLLERVTITDGGFVGIGNTAPTERLAVSGNSSVTGNSTIGGNSIIAGRLGIGTASPLEKLSVIGNASISGNVTALGVTVGNTASLVNGTVRMDTASGKMQYREGGAWKQFSKEYGASGSIQQNGTERNQLVVNPTFEYTVPSSGYYFVTLEADLFPVFQTDGCNLQYLDSSGAVWLYSKTRALQLLSAGLFKWHIVNNGGCQEAQSIPLGAVRTGIIYLQKDEVLSTATQLDMVNPPASPANWASSSRFTMIKVE